jgi:polar amino acid transport system substrate-binding protein
MREKMNTVNKKLQLNLFFLLLIILPCLGACSTAKAVSVSSGQSTYDRVMQSGKIRCGYLVWPPGCIKDPNTAKLSGIGIDTVELVSKKLGLTVEWVEEVSMGTMSEGLIRGRYDLIPTPIWTNANRAKVVNFSNPLYYSPLYVYAGKGNLRFKNHWELINSPKVKIATVDGGTVEIIAQNDFPQATKLSMPELSDNAQTLLSVSTHKADVTFAEPAVANRYMQNNSGTIESINADKPIRIFPNCWMLGRGQFEFKAMLDTVLEEVINSGAMDKIIAKYEKSPNEVMRAALPYQLPKSK